MKFRKKPVEIEATQVGHDGLTSPYITFLPDTPDWIHEALDNDTLIPAIGDDGEEWGWAIVTLEGTMTVSPDDWIIQGIQGELYPCKPDIFDATYEAIDE